MIAISSNRPHLRLIPVLTVGSIFFTFFYLVPSDRRTSAAFLDLAVVVGASILNFPLITSWKRLRHDPDTAIPKIVYSWIVLATLTLISFGMVVAGLIWQVPYRFQLVFQARLAVIGLVLWVIALYAADHISGVAASEEHKGSSLASLQEAFLACEAALREAGAEWSNEAERIRALRDQARYLSPSMHAGATALDQRIRACLQETCDEVRASGQAGLKHDRVGLRLKDCELALSFRKQA